MRREALWREVAAERAWLADLLAGLAPSEWAVHSLAAGWTVRDVAAHLTEPAQAGQGPGPDRGPDALVADLRRSATAARGRRFRRPEPALVEVLVHGQDIIRPLGRERAVTPAAAAAAAREVWARPPFRAAATFPEVAFRATDADLTLGAGTEVHGPALAVLLVLTGRPAALPELAGHATGLVARALGPRP